jgi:uncharacterized OB-fold protein
VVGFIVFVVVVALAVLLLKGFDRVAGRGPKQVRDGVNQSRKDLEDAERRVPCPHCAEKILPAAKICPFCKSTVNAN